ncbi:hypothetical protein [Actinophytocola algeriensis]|uniref:hypothetical protein n=1 Tax=Actinophytocola algeriensis TaxID=1768010 RepID=UPI0016230C85|nr:hypothetical protein [Actinophytocola algeriensis]MBE1477896.1 hypothetical protein [Actinophytocola algeriensis]
MDGGTQVLPVGHDLGVFHVGDGVTAPVQQVRIGADIVDLDPVRFAAWTAAHGVPSEDGSVPSVTADGLRAEHGEEVVADLVRDRLLTAVDPAAPFAEGHRLLPLAQGLGNSPEYPWMFSVGLLYQPLAVMTGAMYDLWQWGCLSPDLWSACAEAAEAAKQAGSTEDEQTDPARMLAGAIGVLPQLLAARVACLDVRIEGLS